MSIIKWRKNNKWFSLYADAIKNRLKRTENLADLTDKTEALKNLGLTGDVETHHHDSRYLPLIEQVKTFCENKFSGLKFKIGGDVADANATKLEDGTYSFNVTNVRANSIHIEEGLDKKMPVLCINNITDKQVKYIKDVTYDATTKTLSVPNITAGIINADEISGRRVYGSYWTDYAEFFKKGEDSEPGDLIILNPDSETEEYIVSRSSNDLIIGIHSDEFGHVIGGEDPIDKEDYLSYNLKRNIPVALAGRVHVNFVGKAKRNSYVVPSNKKGCAELYNSEIHKPEQIIGILVESDNRIDKRRLRIKIK